MLVPQAIRLPPGQWQRPCNLLVYKQVMHTQIDRVAGGVTKDLSLVGFKPGPRGQL